MWGHQILKKHSACLLQKELHKQTNGVGMHILTDPRQLFPSIRLQMANGEAFPLFTLPKCWVSELPLFPDERPVSQCCDLHHLGVTWTSTLLSLYVQRGMYFKEYFLNFPISTPWVVVVFFCTLAWVLSIWPLRRQNPAQGILHTLIVIQSHMCAF